MQLDAKALAAATAEIVQSHVSRAVAPLLQRLETLEGRPAPERGEKGERGEQGPLGTGMAGAMIDRSGVLILTLSNGETRELGPVVGKDGIDGKNGADGEPGQPGEVGQKGDPGERGEQGLAGEPGKDGRDGLNGEVGPKGDPGKDGRDGFKLEDFDARVLEDDRTIELSFISGDHQHIATLKWPTMIDRGVFKADREKPYEAGDSVTWGGSIWTAQRETNAKPDSPDSGWRLSCKKGRDGKDAK